MNKYDSFSIKHLQIYLSSMDSSINKGIIFWAELKEALKLCSMKEILKDNEKEK